MLRAAERRAGRAIYVWGARERVPVVDFNGWSVLTDDEYG